MFGISPRRARYGTPSLAWRKKDLAARGSGGGEERRGTGGPNRVAAQIQENRHGPRRRRQCRARRSSSGPGDPTQRCREFLPQKKRGGVGAMRPSEESGARGKGPARTGTARAARIAMARQAFIHTRTQDPNFHPNASVARPRLHVHASKAIGNRAGHAL